MSLRQLEEKQRMREVRRPRGVFEVAWPIS